MKKHLHSLQKAGPWLLPLSFSLTYILNAVFFYLGLCFQENRARSTFFILGCVLYAVISFILALSALWRERTSWKKLLPLLAVPILFAVFFMESFFRLGIQPITFSYIGRFGLIALPAFCAGSYAALCHSDGTFVKKLEQLSFFVFPLALMYANGALFFCNPFDYGRTLGILNSMNLAYTFMPMLLALVLQFCHDAPLVIPVFRRPLHHPQLCRGLMAIVYWWAIVATGTRGSYFCVLAFCILLMISNLLYKESIRRSTLSFAVIALVLLFCISPFSPPGMRWAGRLNMFIDGLSKGEIVTSVEDTETITEHIDEIVAVDHLSPEVPEESLVEVSEQISSRGTIYKIAFKEFLKNPVFGMAPFGYLVKYSRYPHNVILEMLCDTGIAGTLPMMCLILLAIFRILAAAKEDRAIRCVFLFFAAYAVQAMCSGCLWDCSALLGALGYGLSLPIKNKKTTMEETESSSRFSSV